MRGNMRPHGGSRRDAVFEAGHSAANTALHEIDMYIDMIMKRLPLVLEGYRSMEKQGFDGAPERAAELEQKLDTATKRMQNFSLKDKKN